MERKKVIIMETQNDIQELINQICESDDRELVSTLSKRLRYYGEGKCAYGHQTAELILAKLRELEATDRLSTTCHYSVYYLIRVLSEIAEPQDAQGLANMLLWDEIALDQDRSNHGKLLKGLKRIGDTSVVPILEEYRKIMEKVNYSKLFDDDSASAAPPEVLHQMEQEEIMATIVACQQRPVK